MKANSQKQRCLALRYITMMVINARPWFCARAKKCGWKLELRGSSDVARNFKRGGGIISTFFSSVKFFLQSKVELTD